MKILHVVTLVSPDAAMGGPMRVALHQCQSLAALGHDVTLVAAARGFAGPLPDEFLGVRVVLFPAQTVLPGLGFSSFRARGLGRWLRAHARSFDIVHVHVTRDLVTMPAARRVRRLGVPSVLQPHGQIDPSANAMARFYDPVLTRRELRGASLVLCLTPREAEPLGAVAGGDLRLRDLPNAVDTTIAEGESARDVLFLARLAPRKRPMAFAQAAAAVAADAPGWTFSVTGPDEGESDAVAAFALDQAVPLTLEGPLHPDGVPARMRRSAVYVLPALDEPFGLTVIEAMVQERPVVVTEECGLADVVRDSDSGLVVDTSVEGLTAAIRTLVADAEARERMGRNGRRTVLEQFTVEAAARRLVGYYEEVL